MSKKNRRSHAEPRRARSCSHVRAGREAEDVFYHRFTPISADFGKPSARSAPPREPSFVIFVPSCERLSPFRIPHSRRWRANRQIYMESSGLLTGPPRPLSPPFFKAEIAALREASNHKVSANGMQIPRRKHVSRTKYANRILHACAFCGKEGLKPGILDTHFGNGIRDWARQRFTDLILDDYGFCGSCRSSFFVTDLLEAAKTPNSPPNDSPAGC